MLYNIRGSDGDGSFKFFFFASRISSSGSESYKANAINPKETIVCI